jgi:recombinational DNA repair protein (RecF pathway)
MAQLFTCCSSGKQSRYLCCGTHVKVNVLYENPSVAVYQDQVCLSPHTANIMAHALLLHQPHTLAWPRSTILKIATTSSASCLLFLLITRHRFWNTSTRSAAMDPIRNTATKATRMSTVQPRMLYAKPKVSST